MQKKQNSHSIIQSIYKQETTDWTIGQVFSLQQKGQ
jgi:hypothetical protein